jgi:type I restriction enzyme S subunit
VTPPIFAARPLKRCVVINPETLPEDYDPTAAIEYVDIGNVEQTRGIVSTEKLSFRDAPSRARRLVRSGDTIISTVRTYLKAVAPIENPPENMVVSTGFAVLRPSAGVYPKFLAWLAQSDGFVQRVEAHSVGVSYPAINPSVLGSLSIHLPPLDDQRSTADFLDRQTARIDELIAKKVRLIELLKERSSRLVHHLVRRGVTEPLASRDCGFDWIGHIPVAWETVRMGSLSRIVRGSTPRPAGDLRYFHGDAMPWVTVGEITNNDGPDLDATESMLTAEGVHFSRTIEPGTLLLTNSGATLGVPKILRVRACANDGVLAFEDLDAGILIDYLYYYLRSCTGMFRERTKQGAGQPNLNTHIVASTACPLPNIEEQRRIVACIQDRTRAGTKLVEKVITGAARLREYRTALISAAVTGQIDTRTYRKQPEAVLETT